MKTPRVHVFELLQARDLLTGAGTGTGHTHDGSDERGEEHRVHHVEPGNAPGHACVTSSQGRVPEVRPAGRNMNTRT